MDSDDKLIDNDEIEGNRENAGFENLRRRFVSGDSRNRDTNEEVSYETDEHSINSDEDDDHEAEQNDDPQAINRRYFFRRWLDFFRYFNIVQERVILDLRLGILWHLGLYIIVAINYFLFFTELERPETRVTGFVEGDTYSVSEGSARLWTVEDLQLPGYYNQQIFVPTVVRITQNQQQDF